MQRPLEMINNLKNKIYRVSIQEQQVVVCDQAMKQFKSLLQY